VQHPKQKLSGQTGKLLTSPNLLCDAFIELEQLLQEDMEKEMMDIDKASKKRLLHDTIDEPPMGMEGAIVPVQDPDEDDWDL
jgi:hypothetical protein